MRYAKDRKEQTRRSIVRSAAKLFAAKGFKATSIDDIMRDCNLTRGGFYAHFQSKSQLYRHAMTVAAQSAARRHAKSDGDWLERLIDEYLRTNDRAFFAVDAASSEPDVRAAYANAYEALKARITAQGSYDEATVLSVASLLIGAVGIARTLDDADAKSKLADACKLGVAILLGDAQQSFFWEPPRRSDWRGLTG
jgi:TetR/AcrR family transcriptional repressor of nem operon